MLVQFSFKNFGPFKEEVVFDMRAIKSYKEHPYNLYVENDKNSLLKVAAIYGANASGKSNFVKAYNYFWRLIRGSFSQKDKERESILSACYDPFIFDNSTSNADTEFCATYHQDGNEYKYGFIYNSERIVYEWLYRKSLATNRQSTIFERDPVNGLELGASIKRSCDKYISSVDDDVLALSFFSSLKLRNHIFKDVLWCVTSIFSWCSSCDIPSDYLMDLYFEQEFNDNEEKTQLLSFLESIDVGIKDISVERNNNNIAVFTYHLGKDGSLYQVPIEIESAGTKRAIAIYSVVKIAVTQDKGIIIDELNNQLHPLLTKYIVDMFYDENSSGQLIYTTHDTTLLDKRFMRRDQVWFTEKNTDGEASLFSLAEFKVRNDTSFEKEYLGGVYGAIPILKNFSFMEE